MENVRGLLSVNDGRAFGEILGDMAELGYDAEWDLFSASGVGAPHQRKRVFILARLAQSDYARRPSGIRQESVVGIHPEDTCAERFGTGNLSMADAEVSREEPAQFEGRGRRVVKSVPSMADAERQGLLRSGQQGDEGTKGVWGAEGFGSRINGRDVADAEDPGPVERSDELPPWPPGPTDLDSWQEVLKRWPQLEPAVADAARISGSGNEARESRGRDRASDVSQGRDEPDGGLGNPSEEDGRRFEEEAQPSLRRMADGPSNRVDRLRALGNAVVPVCAAVAFLHLAKRLVMTPESLTVKESTRRPPL